MNKPILILISANSEWRVVRSLYTNVGILTTPFGEAFSCQIDGHEIIYCFGGWGKISAAASAQYAITRWQPALVINLGTCGGLAGAAQRGDVIAAEKTLVYDIYEQMGDPQQAVDFYASACGAGLLQDPLPDGVRRTVLVSADRDIFTDQVVELREKYDACAADWESGAIAWVAARNQVPCLILRGVSDVVGPNGGEAYVDPDVFESGSRTVMTGLMESLPFWLTRFDTQTGVSKD